MRNFFRFLVIASAVACSSRRAAVAPAPVSASDSHPSAGLPFIEDDYPRALADAKARHVPIFVDAWAPW